MIKYFDLMPGDWVEIDNKYERIQSVNPGNDMLSYGEDGWLTNISRRVKQIPITSKILESNGFYFVDTEDEPDHYHSPIYNLTLYIIDTDNGTGGLTLSTEPTGGWGATIYWVSELQHLLGLTHRYHGDFKMNNKNE